MGSFFKILAASATCTLNNAQSRTELIPNLLETEIHGKHFYVAANGIKFHYVKKGSGKKTVLFLHGFPQCWFAWRNVLDEFKETENYTCLALDLRGFGGTERPQDKESYTMQTYVNDVIQFCTALNLEKVVLIGHDFGAVIAWRVAELNPKTVERVILINPPTVPVEKVVNSANLDATARIDRASFYSSSPSKAKYPFAQELKRSFNSSLYFKLNDYEILDVIFETKSRSRVEAAIDNYKAILAHDGGVPPPLIQLGVSVLLGEEWVNNSKSDGNKVSATNQHLGIPAVIIWSDQDSWNTEQPTNKLLDSLKSEITFFKVPNGGHWLPEDVPSEISQSIRHFMEGTLAMGL